VWEGERERHSKVVERVCESVRGREGEIERGVEREVNVGERGRCRRDRGEIVGWGGRERGRVCESVRGGERNTKRGV
jgi:hypothetical protein